MGGQDQARFISIPVPKAAAGGVVDLAPGEDHARPGSELIQQLERALRANRESLRRWVRIAWLRRNKVNSLMDEFVNKVGANSAHDRRIARKFGFVYAAGIAVNRGFLYWRTASRSRLRGASLARNVRARCTLTGTASSSSCERLTGPAGLRQPRLSHS